MAAGAAAALVLVVVDSGKPGESLRFAERDTTSRRAADENFDAVWSFCWADLFYVPSLKWVSSVRGTQYDLTQKASCSHCKFLLARHRVPGRTPITISKF